MAPLKDTFRVAIYDEFLDAFARIPRAQQKKVQKFLSNFRENPTSASINYESISSFAVCAERSVVGRKPIAENDDLEGVRAPGAVNDDGRAGEMIIDSRRGRRAA